jgi:hypothetical protein
MGQFFLTLRRQLKYSKEKAKKPWAMGSKKNLSKKVVAFINRSVIFAAPVPSFTLRKFSSL